MFDIREFQQEKSVFSKTFLDRYKNTTVQWGPMGYLTYYDHYSRLDETLGRKETWVESLQRICMGIYTIQKAHCRVFNRPWNDEKAVKNAHKMFDQMFHFKWLPPGRGLWAMGSSAMYRHGASVLNNCAFKSTHDGDFEAFCWILEMSMLGVGVGFDTDGAGKMVVYSPRSKARTTSHTVDDSREGWVHSTRLLLKSYLQPGQPPVQFRYHKIRKEGEILRGIGGVASGPEPLKQLHKSMRNLLDGYTYKTLDSAGIVDLANIMGRCAVSGNIRRSAELALGAYGDETFANLKLDREKVMEWRYISNNSIKCELGCDYTKYAAMTAVAGDPGYYWPYNARFYGRMNGHYDPKDWRAKGANPCVEQTLEDTELCNLVEMFPSKHNSLHDYFRSVKMAYLYAKTVTLISTGFEETDDIIERNRRIGCSQSGLIRAFNKFGRQTMIDWSDKVYDYTGGLDTDYSCWFGINRSIKRTSIKPSGTVPLLPGETSALNYPEGEFYYRVKRVASTSPLLPALEKAGYQIYPDEYGGQESSDTMVVYVPVHEPYFDRSVKDVSMWEQLENVAAMQQYYADNQVSATIKFTKTEAKDISRALDIYQNRLKAITFLPQENDGFHKHMPLQKMTEKEYAEAIKNLKPLKLSGITTDNMPRGCDGESCEL